MFTGWPQVGDAVMGLLHDRVGAPVNDVVDEMAYAAAGQAYLEWVTYRGAAELHTQLVEPDMTTDLRMLDAMTLCATRIATRMSMSQVAAEGLLHRAIVLRDRLPHVFECLRNGQVSPRHIRTICSRTELIDGQDYADEVDAAIAESLRRKGSWSEQRMRDMIDRIVYRHDPDAVREQRRRAKDDRSFWLERTENGMAEVGASMTAENALLAFEAACARADLVCSDDGRTQAQRRSDASYTLHTGVTWECMCGNGACDAAATPVTVDDAETSDDTFRNESAERTHSDTAADSDSENGEDTSVSPAAPAKVRHCHSHSTGNRRQRRAAAKLTRTLRAFTDPATAAGSAEHPGFLDGFGVISADHVRDLTTSSGVRVHVLGNRVDATGAVIPLPCTQPADPYRPSTALQTFVRARDQYCVWPGCDRPATKPDLDHAAEYDHDHPSAGGQTRPDGAGRTVSVPPSRQDVQHVPDRRVHRS